MWSLFFSLYFTICLSACMESEGTESIAVLTDEVNKMQECQMHSDNKSFYLHKYKADNIIGKYSASYIKLSPKDQRDFTIARSRYSLILADYLMQTGRRQDAINAIDILGSNSTQNISADTMLWLDYLCHQGSIRFRPFNIKKHTDNLKKGYDCLMQCYFIASRSNKKYFESMSLQLLSRYLANDSIFQLVKLNDAASLRYINEDGVSETLLAGNLAERALFIAEKLNDNRLLVSSWMNLALCYFNIGDANNSIQCLIQASKTKGIDSMPALKATLNEQLSMSYAAIDDKYFSDFYRNAYLDLQDSTRQDRELEARATALEESASKIWMYVGLATLIFILLCIITFTLNHLRKRDEKKADKREEEIEFLEDSLRAMQLQYSNEQRAAIEQRARIAIINGMLPLIDRMQHAVDNGNNTYATELAREIEKQNTMITQWIKLRQGSIAPRIESIPLQEILNIVKKNAPSLQHNGITLNICDTDSKVKADRALTLFLINTLVDNARKAMPQGGCISITCTDNNDEKYTEISVKDDGNGMTEEQVAHLFEYKTINDEPTDKLRQGQSANHGFGLQNCRGIIDRYRKISSLFSVCTISAESQVGKGTTIHFRLPMVVRTIILLFTIVTASLSANAQNIKADTLTTDTALIQGLAERYADSLYSCNINGHYAEAMLYSDSCINVIQRYKMVNPSVRLAVYNETAVAALALHQWRKYSYYNYLYTQLYKDCTADSSLATYCQTIASNKNKANCAMFIMLLLIASLIPVFWFVYLRHVIKRRKGINKHKEILNDDLNKAEREYSRLHVINNITDNQLSTLKHETMYYPTRICMQIDNGDEQKEIQSTIAYYRDLFNTLSNQAMGKQLSAFSFPMSTAPLCEVIPGLDNEEVIICNRELMTYLRVLLKRHNGNKTPHPHVIGKYGHYIRIAFDMDHADYNAEQAVLLFAPSTHNADFLIMRQIMRETGNTTNSYGCGIMTGEENGKQVIIITVSLFSA